MSPEQLALACARICDELKGGDMVILDLRKLTSITDYFVLCTGASERQLKAISNKLLRDLKDQGVRRFGAQGDPASGWILLDYVDVVVHIFSPTARDFYELEMLWGDAPRLDWAPAAADREIREPGETSENP